MKKDEEMISLNFTKNEFDEEMSLDERLQRLKTNELKSIKAGAICQKDACWGMACIECNDRCEDNYCEHCDDCWDCWDYGCESDCDFCPEDREDEWCRRMEPT